MQIVSDAPRLAFYAKTFMDNLNTHLQVKNTPAEVVMAGLDYIKEEFTQLTPGGGYFVRPAAEIGVQSDIFDGIPDEEWHLHLFNPTLDFSNISLFTVDEARKWFLETLSVNILANTSNMSKEEVVAHTKRHIYSMFNASNRNHLKFDLVYVDYHLFEGEYTESMDLGDLLIV